MRIRATQGLSSGEMLATLLTRLAHTLCGNATETLSLRLMEEFATRVFVTGATGYIGYRP